MAALEDTLDFTDDDAKAFIKFPDRHTKLETLWEASGKHNRKPFPDGWKEGGELWGKVDSIAAIGEARGAAQFKGLLAVSAEPEAKAGVVAAAGVPRRLHNTARNDDEQKIFEVRHGV